MGTLRKLQGEIDRTLKKVAEGIDVFDQIWNKVHDCDNANQKEKYEGDLKKEIKKLQRYRDQIKTWAASSDIKDKQALLDARKQIEREMERFKVCEKETKTKAFSKEGLGQAAKIDPKDKARYEMRDWLNSTVETLQTQIDEYEFEIETLTSNMKKNKPPPRLAHFEESISRHKEHIRRLEQMLRLLDNETITPDDVANVKDMVDDYLERGQEDFDEFACPDDLYDELLEQLDSANKLDALPAPPIIEKKADKKSDKEKEEREAEREAERKREKDRQLAANLKNQARGLPPVPPSRSASVPDDIHDASDKKGSSRAAPAVAKEPPAPTPASQAPAPPPQQAPPPAAPAVTVPPPASQTMPTQRVQSEPLPVTSRPEPQAPGPSVTEQATGRAGMSPDMIPGRNVFAGAGGPAAQSSPAPPAAPPGMAGAVPGQSGSRQASWMFSSAGEQAGFPQVGESRRAEILPDQKNRYLSRYQQVQQGVGNLSGMMDPAAGQLKMQQPEEGGPAKLLPQPSAAAAADGAPGAPPMSYSSTIANQQLLQSCAMRSIPQPGDSNWSRYGVRPRVPQGVTIPPSYPATKPAAVDNPNLFEKLDSEALFFAFYHQPGTYQQYLAARELKRQSWRYHKVHGAWFQRHEEPSTITDEYEQGTYIYFDYNIMHDDMQSGWCYRLKQDFTFEYDALEDELAV
mmetsp:Transcript_32597/g.92416  ORF Transcript_32597/g.92416 Transcript_32597/m.92416 type:complete len:687 (-) Transcript_32597:89-2149(-)